MKYQLSLLPIFILLFSVSGCQKSSSSKESSVASPMTLPLDLKREVLHLPSKVGALAPSLHVSDSMLHMVWLERPVKESKLVQLHYAEFQNGLWGNQKLLHESENFFANWADTPSVTVNAKGNILVHWAEKSGAATYAYDVRYGMIQGDTFQDLGVLHKDKTQSEHGFVSVVAAGDSFDIVWLDGRKTGGGAHNDGHHQSSSGGMTLRHVSLSPKGLTLSTELDERVCDCCNTSAVNASAGLIVAYRDRSENEIRDISIVRSSKEAWNKPQKVSADGWEIEGCPVNGPSLAHVGDTTALAWFTKAKGNGEVKIKFSQDSGITWGPTFSVDTDDPIGRVDLVALPNQQFVVSWLGKSAKEASINLRRVGANGTMSPTSKLKYVSASRKTGIPRIALAHDILSVVWTEESNDSTVLQGHRVSWQAIGTPLLAEVTTAASIAERPITQFGDLSLKTGDGQAFTRTSNGAPQLVAFWADWCRPCWEELIHLETLRTQHKLTVILVTTHTEDATALEASIRAKGYTGPITYVNSEDFPSTLELNELPASWVVDAEGKVQERITGLLKPHDPRVIRYLRPSP